MTTIAPELSPEVAEELAEMRDRLDRIETELCTVAAGVAELLCRVRAVNAPPPEEERVTGARAAGRRAAWLLHRVGPCPE